MSEQAKAVCEIEVDIFHDDYRNRSAQIRVHERHQMTVRARLAATLMERWGATCPIPDGEDSSGRAKVRLQTPAEMVDRACETADRAVAEFHARGWMVEKPSLAALDAFVKTLDDDGGRRK